MQKRDVSKREQFSEAPQSKARKVTIGVLIAVPLLILVTYVGVNIAGTQRQSGETVVAKDGMIRIPLAKIGSKASVFQYKTRNHKTVRFFAIKSSDGVYRAAADACQVCYREKMGYHQEGDDMVCKKCGQHFASKDVNEITGGCNPDALPRRIDGQNLLIAAAELDAREYLF